MRNLTHDASLLPPRIIVDLSPSNRRHRRLLEGELARITDVPVMGHNAETSFAESLFQVDRASDGGVGSCRPFGSRVIWKSEMTEEVIGSSCASAESVNLVDVRLGCYVMGCNDELEFHGSVQRDDYGFLRQKNWVATDDPMEIFSLPASFTIEADLSSCKRAPVLDDKAFGIVKGKTEVTGANTPMW